MQHMHVEQNANRSLGNKVKSTGVRTRIPIEIKLEALSSHSFQFEIPNRFEAYEKKNIFCKIVAITIEKLIADAKRDCKEAGCHAPAIAPGSNANIPSGTHKSRLLERRICGRGTFLLARTLGHGVDRKTENGWRRQY